MANTRACYAIFGSDFCISLARCRKGCKDLTCGSPDTEAMAGPGKPRALRHAVCLDVTTSQEIVNAISFPRKK